jgi:hypothetical protein
VNAPTELALAAQPTPRMDTSTSALMFMPERMTSMLAMAEVMASGMSTIPQHLRKNKGDCMAVCMQAAQWGMNPFAVAQKTHVVNGTLGYEAQLVNAVVTTMAPTKDRINYEWFGNWDRIMGKFEERESKKKIDEDTGKPLKYRVPAWGIKDEEGLGIKVWATMKGENEPRVLTLLLVQCRTRNSPLWADDPRQQIAYLGVKRWTRLHCPDVLLGVYTPDELQDAPVPRDMGAAEVVPPTGSTAADIPPGLIRAAEQAAANGVAAYQKFWQATGPANRKLLADRHEGWKADATAADAARTVDTDPKPHTAPMATATSAADADGALDDDFVAEMNAAEKGGAA